MAYGTSGADIAPPPLTALSTQEAVNSLLEFAAKDNTRFETGWSVDDSCGRLGLGEMMLVWARSGCGKSTLVLNLVRNTPEVPTLVISMEMSARRQIEWLTSMTFGMQVASRDIEEVLKWPDDPRHDELKGALQGMQAHYPALHFSMPNRPSVSDLGYLLEDVEGMTGFRPQRVCIDHLGLMRDCMDYTGFSRTAGELHHWALQEGLALVVIQQTGRSGDSSSRNDGHIPVSLSSGVYGGEADADWIWGMYRPDRDPRFKKSKFSFKDIREYEQMLIDYEQVKGTTVLQVIKNRTYGDTLEQGIELRYEPHSRRLIEPGTYDEGGY